VEPRAPEAAAKQRTTSLETLRATTERHCPDGWSPPRTILRHLAFALLAARHTSATRAAIGGFLGITGQAAGQLIAVAEQRSRSDDHLMRLIATLESDLRQFEDEPY
jgi:hypothetical protein